MCQAYLKPLEDASSKYIFLGLQSDVRRENSSIGRLNMRRIKEMTELL
jgi:hypothetical protein